MSLIVTAALTLSRMPPHSIALSGADLLAMISLCACRDTAPLLVPAVVLARSDGDASAVNDDADAAATVGDDPVTCV
jgi:hypothetical protein